MLHLTKHLFHKINASRLPSAQVPLASDLNYGRPTLEDCAQPDRSESAVDESAPALMYSLEWGLGVLLNNWFLVGSFPRNINCNMIKILLRAHEEWMTAWCRGPCVPFDGFKCHFRRRTDIWFVAQQDVFSERRELHVAGGFGTVS